MQIRLVRTHFTEHSTIGEMQILDEATGQYHHQCYTLEDTVRAPGVKIFGRTAIPYGTYSVVIDRSVHFGRDLPHVLDVPNFEGIRIHSGNRPEDTEGCILVGLRVPESRADWIELSHAAFDPLFLKMKAAGVMTLEIVEMDIIPQPVATEVPA